ncbi:hypothetical protein, partial [Streptomyces longwoodensis]|uniref:hypothetical protein n=1 Tax=Streptomyces longwoodensis TaxID=68231 RepID=UPI001B80B055
STTSRPGVATTTPTSAAAAFATGCAESVAVEAVGDYVDEGAGGALSWLGDAKDARDLIKAGLKVL